MLFNYEINDKINDKRDITVSLSSADIEINPGSHLKSLTYVKTINDDHVSGEFTVDKLSPEIRKQLENKDINMKYKRFYIFNPLPSVPDDIDDLFEFVSKQGGDSSNPNDVYNREDTSLEVEKSTTENVDANKSLKPNHSQDNLSYLDSKETFKGERDKSDKKSVKIFGDAEIIDNQSTLLRIKSEKLTGRPINQNTKFSSNTSNSPYDEYITNESEERFNNKPTTISPYVSPGLKKQSLKADMKFHSSKEERILNDDIKYILLIRKH